MTKRAVVLLSGGLDSATVTAIARHEGYSLYALSFDYGQRHRWELEGAKKVAQSMEVRRHVVMTIDLRQFGGSALTTDDIAVPEKEQVAEQQDIIPVTYVPARNTVFLSFALGWAEVLETGDIFIGVNAVDYSGYPDCRPEYIEAYQKMARLATKAGVEGREVTIHTPLIDLTKGEIVEKGLNLGVDYGITHSCYNPNDQGISCGICAACQLRLQGFKDAGAKDPIEYQ